MRFILSTKSRSAALCAVFLSIVAITGCTESAVPRPADPAGQPVVLKELFATLAGANEIPAILGSGTGIFEAIFDPAKNTLSWTVTYAGLSGVASAARFHGPAFAGENAPAVNYVNGKLTSPISGVMTLNATQIIDLHAGKWYFNIYTKAYPNGEIRGQLQLKP